MLSGSSPLPYGVSAHFVARREFFKRIRVSLHCVRRTLQRGALPSRLVNYIEKAAESKQAKQAANEPQQRSLGSIAFVLGGDDLSLRQL